MCVHKTARVLVQSTDVCTPQRASFVFGKAIQLFVVRSGMCSCLFLFDVRKPEVLLVIHSTEYTLQALSEAWGFPVMTALTFAVEHSEEMFEVYISTKQTRLIRTCLIRLIRK